MSRVEGIAPDQVAHRHEGARQGRQGWRAQPRRLPARLSQEPTLKDAFPRGQTAIVAAATYGVGTAPGLSTFDLAAHASVKALAQVGLKPKDVDGLFCVVMDETLSGLNFEEYLGVRSRINDNARTGGSSFQIQASIAALALASGPVRRRADRLRQQPAQRARQARDERTVLALGGTVQAAAPDLVVCDGRGAPHAPVRHDEATARRSRDRGAQVGATEPGCVLARRADHGGVPRCAHGRRSVRRPRLLPRHRWRRRRRHDAGRSRARPVRETRVPAGRRARDARIAKSRACRTSR